MRRRPLNDADKALWAAFAEQIQPLPGRRPVAVSLESPKPVGVAPVPASRVRAPLVAVGQVADPSDTIAAWRGSHRPPPRKRGSQLVVGDQPGGLDSGTWHRFQSGKLVAVRTLDLHGMTVQAAYHRLHAFLRSAHADGARCVEVVTGRGSGENGGAIRREFTHWLNLPDIRPMILGAAHPHALNPGSVRLILRRVR